jgi:hypothetical protein
MTRMNRTRRALLLGALAPALAPAFGAAGQAAARRGFEPLPADWTRFADRATEFDLLRLTRPEYASSLSAPPGRSVSRRADFAIVASARTGTAQLLRIDLHTGEVLVLTAAAALHPSAYTLAADDRAVYYFDGPRLFALPLKAPVRPAVLWTAPEVPAPGAALGGSADGALLCCATPTGNGFTLWTLRPDGRSPARAILRRDEPIEAPLVNPNPHRTEIAWRGGSAIWTVERTGGGARRLATPAGAVLQAAWSPDGQSLLYLHDPLLEPNGRVHPATLREQTLDSREDREVARTSQFACFARNGDASVFAGASRSKASPFVALLLRATRRELPLCEHHATNAAATCLAFAPNSQLLLFQGDREGASTVYAIRLERLVERTEG